MSMTKVIPAGGWDFGVPTVSMLKVSSQGLRGSDLTSLVKRAGHYFADKYRDFKCAKDEVPMHVVAMGSTEKWGSNRNADGFREKMLKKCGHTFISRPITKQGAYWFRNHKNKNPRKSYGIVKDSWYNPEMHRQELIVLLNAEKSAAERNGGLVADEELEKIARGEDIPVSMAVKVPFDVCSYCGNRARTRAEYCGPDTCKAGGCRDNLGRVVKIGNDIVHLYVDNPDGNFFDISKVFRGADRTAYANVADYIQKAANDGSMGGAELAEALGVTAPLGVLLDTDYDCTVSDRVRRHAKLAYGLAAMQETAPEPLPEMYKRAFDGRLRPQLDFSMLSNASQIADGLAALADEKITIKLADFARLTARDDLADAAIRLLPAACRKLAEAEDLVRILANNPYDTDRYPSAELRTWAKHAAPAYSLEENWCSLRAMRSSIRDYEIPEVDLSIEKVAWEEGGSGAKKLARDYALYQIAALDRIAGKMAGFTLTPRLSLDQNYL